MYNSHLGNYFMLRSGIFQILSYLSLGGIFGPYGSFQGYVVLHINGTYLCSLTVHLSLNLIFSLSLSFYLSQIEACQYTLHSFLYLAFFITKGESDFKGLGASLARSGLEPSFPLNFRTGLLQGTKDNFLVDALQKQENTFLVASHTFLFAFMSVFLSVTLGSSVIIFVVIIIAVIVAIVVSVAYFATSAASAA